MEKFYVSSSAHVTKLLIDLAEENGWKVCETFKEEYAGTLFDGSLRWPIFVLDSTVWGRHYSSAINHVDSRIGLEAMIEHLERKRQISRFKLNEEYTATIDKHNKTVQVGCQTFSFDVLRELVAKFD